MPKRKPQGWPRYMVEKRLAGGAIAYYWGAPSWGKEAGWTIGSVPLGSDYGAAKEQCDTVLNPQFDGWRTGGAVTPGGSVQHGTFDWMVSVYKRSPQYTDLSVGTRADYDRALHDVSKLPTKDGKRRMGEMMLSSITAGVVDKVYARLRVKGDGASRERSAKAAINISKLAWNVARRAQPKVIPQENSFKGVSIKYEAQPTRPATHDELVRFVAAADLLGHASVGTAAMIAFYWLQRQVDILTRLSWPHYKPGGSPIARIWHHKTGELIDLPLFDDDGTALWPELMDRLEKTERRGTLIVMRDRPDRRRKVHLPWLEDYFRHVVAKIREAAEIDPEVKFMGLRHGGNTEGADAGLTDAQLRALSGHKSAALLRYALETKKQRVEGARMRRDAREGKGRTNG